MMALTPRRPAAASAAADNMSLRMSQVILAVVCSCPIGELVLPSFWDRIMNFQPRECQRGPGVRCNVDMCSRSESEGPARATRLARANPARPSANSQSHEPYCETEGGPPPPYTPSKAKREGPMPKRERERERAKTSDGCSSGWSTQETDPEKKETQRPPTP